MAAKKNTGEKCTYLLMMKDGTKQKVTVPSHWKVTFGNLTPGNNGHNASPVSIRFYDGVHQKAVFTNLESFRDLSIGIEEEVVKTQAETFYKDTPQGKRQVVMEGTVREWRNPDAPVVASEGPARLVAIPDALKTIG